MLNIDDACARILRALVLIPLPVTALLGFALPLGFAPLAIPWRLFAQPFIRPRLQAIVSTPALSLWADKCTAQRGGRVHQRSNRVYIGNFNLRVKYRDLNQVYVG
jgi:hypothetical protein